MKLKHIVLGAILCFASILAQAQVTPSTCTTNCPATLLASAARTAATVNSPDVNNYQWRGATVYLNVSAFTSGTYTVRIQGKDPVSGLYADICVGTAVGSVSLNKVEVYPGIAASANITCNDTLPRVWRVQMTGATSPSMTFSVGAVYMQ